MKPLRTPALIACAGALLLALLFARFDPSAIFPTSLDRKQSIQRAREISSKYGVDTTGWNAFASQQADDKHAAYLTRFPGDATAHLFTAVSWRVLLTRAGTAIQVQLFADGRPQSWEIVAGEPPSSAVDSASLLTAFAGNRASCFTESGHRPVSGKQLTDWTCAAEALSLRFEAATRDGRLVSAKLSPVYAASFVAPSTSVIRGIGEGIAGFVSFIGFFLALFLTVRACVRRELDWRFPLAVLAALALWTALSVAGGPEYQSSRYAWYDHAPAQDNVEAQPGAEMGFKIGVVMSFVAPVFFPFLSVLAFAGAGFALSQKGAGALLRPKWRSIRTLLEGRMRTRQVALPLAAGLLCGIAVAGARYGVAWFAGGLFGAAPIVFHDRYAMSAPVPFLVLPHWFAVIPAFSYLGFWWALAVHLSGRRTRSIVAAVIAVLYIVGPADVFATPLPSLILSAVAAAAYLWLYLAFDLLAVAAAMLAVPAILEPLVLLVQSSGGLREWGVYLLALLGAILVTLLHLAIRGADADQHVPAPSDTSADLAPQSLSHRKRLEAEFAVARKAQQDALPSSAPVIEGYSFSASCDPAQQVGGDLYDMFPLPDGRLGIAVADVSGKGVPAALYMMVTKGLLTATSQQSSDLTHIMTEVNHHLYRVCKRKMFVTMAAVAMDPARRRMEYARAGHNPIVWRHTNRGATELRKPPGLGLGMTIGDRFARTLRLEELELEHGDAVVLYSDGVTEAMNAASEQFGEARLIRSIEGSDGQSAGATRAAILRDLAAFTAGTPPHDDVTIVVVRVGEHTN